MKLVDIPERFPIPFADGAGPSFVHQVPTASQVGITAGAASLTDGFPPDTFVPVGAGGIPPFGIDMNGIINQATAWSRWQGAGAPSPYNAVFAAAIGGYPRGSIIAGEDDGVFWLSIVDDNETDPDNTGVGWVPWGCSVEKATSGAAHTYENADLRYLVTRSNAGAAMIDTLPGTGNFLDAGQPLQIFNDDDAALLVIKPAAGASISIPGDPGWVNVILGPKQTAVFVSDGAGNYRAVSVPDRVKLADGVTIFVATTGDNANAGVTVATPWADLQTAIDRISGNFDFSGHDVTIQAANGTYARFQSPITPFVGCDQDASLTVRGDPATPGNCIINSALSCVVSQGADFDMLGFKITSSGGNGIVASDGGIVRFSAMDFGACAGAHILAVGGGMVVQTLNYTVSGGAQNHILASAGAVVMTQAGTATVSGTPAFSLTFASATTCGTIQIGTAFSFAGGATGKRYFATLNGVINVNNVVGNVFPGNAVGTTDTGGQYQ